MRKQLNKLLNKMLILILILNKTLRLMLVDFERLFAGSIVRKQLKEEQESALQLHEE